jgi:hypothetical protein
MKDRKTTLKERQNPTHPLPPLNLDVLYAFDSKLNAFDIRWDDPNALAGNAQWHILGVNLYRSHDSEFGPYHRINDVPLGAGFYRDQTTNEEVLDEDVTEQFLARGENSTAGRWVFRVSNYPIVKPVSEAVAADHPLDVIVKIDGKEVIPAAVYGSIGEVELRIDKTYDMGTNSLIDPILPNPESMVTCSYRYNINLVQNELDRKIFYRATSVGYREWDGELRETPLEWTESKTIHHIENMDYIWREAIRRNSWILDQGGERVFLFIRKWSGDTCQECWDHDYKHPRNSCLVCYGTGIEGGYEGPFEIRIAPQDGEKRIGFDQYGFSIENVYEVWTGPSPMLSQRDFIVKQNNDRYSLGPIRMPTNRGNVLQQHFQIDILEENDIRYKVPLNLGENAFPETRVRTWDDEEGKVSSPQITDKETVPDGLQERGRTATYDNITK